MKAGYTISAAAHVLVLGWGLLTFSAKPLEAPPVDAVVADVITDTEFSQITNGSKTAKQTPKPAPVVDRVGEVKEPPKEPTLKVADNKQEVLTETAPPPAPPQPDPKPDLKPDLKPDPKPAEAKPPELSSAATPPAAAEPPPPDPVAEALRQEEAKRKEKEAEAKRKAEEAKRKAEEAKRKAEEAKRKAAEEAKKREELKSHLDRIETALLDKRAPQRQAVTGTIVNPAPSLGTTTGNAPQLSQNELARLQAMVKQQLYGCWIPPIGASEARDLVVLVAFSLNRDGTLAGNPVVKNRASNPLFQIAAESAVRAVRSCSPLRLPAAKYESWQEVEVDFNLKELFGG
jgi:colicin import membrane protein